MCNPPWMTPPSSRPTCMEPGGYVCFRGRVKSGGRRRDDSFIRSARRMDGRTHDDAVAERGPVLELQGLEDVPELLRHGGMAIGWHASTKWKFNHQRARREAALCSETPGGRGVRSANRPMPAPALAPVVWIRANGCGRINNETFESVECLGKAWGDILVCSS